MSINLDNEHYYPGLDVSYFERTHQNLYRSKKVKMPVPELYVIYTGERKTKPSRISLSKEFFDGNKSSIDVKVKMIYDGKKGNIINQYVTFTRGCDKQVALYGRTREAIMETIRICKDKNVLKEYLESQEREVVDIMMTLYDEEEIMRSYIRSEVQDGIQEGIQKAVHVAVQDTQKNIAKEMIRENESIEKIMKYSLLSREAILELQQNIE